MMAKCRLSTKDVRITFAEQRSTITFVNRKRDTAVKIHVDGCEITSGIRCDHMLVTASTERYIELKGQDIEHAVKQIIATIKALSVDPSKHPKFSYVICTRSPLASAEIQNLQVKFKKQFNCKLIVKSSPHECDL